MNRRTMLVSLALVAVISNISAAKRFRLIIQAVSVRDSRMKKTDAVEILPNSARLN